MALNDGELIYELTSSHSWRGAVFGENVGAVFLLDFVLTGRTGVSTGYASVPIDQRASTSVRL